MQQPNQVFTPPMNLTTEQIQKYLEENKKLIVAIMDNQNQGNADSCAMYLNQLQSNLMFLARIADTQPQASKIASQSIVDEEKAMQAASSQVAISSQQQPGFSASKSPFPANDQQQQQQQQQQQHRLSLQQHQFMQTQMGFFSPQPSQMGTANNFLNVPGGNRQDADAGDRFGR